MIWPHDEPDPDATTEAPPPIEDGYPWDEDTEDELPDEGIGESPDYVELADLEAATRADMRIDERATDYDGAGWPF